MIVGRNQVINDYVRVSTKGHTDRCMDAQTNNTRALPIFIGGCLIRNKTQHKPVLRDVIAEILCIHLHENTQCNQVCMFQIIEILSISINRGFQIFKKLSVSFKARNARQLS